MSARLANCYNAMKTLSYLSMFILGAAGCVAFAPWNLWWMAVISIGGGYFLLFAPRAIPPKRKGISACFWGAGWGVANFYWTAGAIPSIGLRVAVWVILAILGAVVFGMPFIAAARQPAGWRRVLAFAVGAAGALYIREVLINPWNPLANIALGAPSLAVSMSAVGAIGLTFVIAGCIAGAVEIMIPEQGGATFDKSRRPRFARITAAFGRRACFIETRPTGAVFFFALLFILWALPRAGDWAGGGKNIRLVQPVFSAEDKADKSLAKINIARLMGLSFGGEFLPDLIIWPETSWPNDVEITDKLASLGTSVLTGAIFRDGPQRRYNAALYIGNDGRIIDSYFKRRLVPFAEEKLFGDLVPSAADFTRGRAPKNIAGFAPLICYESAWSGAIAGRPDFIVNITNDGWIAGTGAVQHIDMARRMAIETGLPVAFANNSGPSAVIDGTGRIIANLDPGIVGFLDVRVGPHRVSIYRRIGLNGVFAIILALYAVVLFGGKKKD